MDLRGIIFDLDDTIISFDVSAGPTWKYVCEKYTSESKVISAKALFKAIDEVRKGFWSNDERHKKGRSNLKSARRKIVKEAFQRLGLENMNDAIKVADSYSVERMKQIELFPKTIETLDYFKKSKIQLSLLTNGESHLQRSKISRFKLYLYFDFIFIEEEVGFGKPEEKAYLNVLEKMSLEPEHVWSVGDNLVWDVKVPQQLGIYSIWNDFNKTGLPFNSHIIPNRIINNISELVPRN